LRVSATSILNEENAEFIESNPKEIRIMAKEKSVQKNSPKKVAEKSLMEKRAAKKAKQKSKGKND
jgi:hypothetical protein